MPSKNFKLRCFLIIFLLFLLIFLFLKKDFLPETAFFGKILKFNLFLAKSIFSLKSEAGSFQENARVYFKSKKKLISENENLKEENLRLSLKGFKADILEKENERLLEIVGRKPENNFSIASVLFRPPMTDFDTLIADAGLNQRIQKGMMVTAYNDIILGEVEEVFESSSKVKLFSYYGTKTNIFFEKAGIAAVAFGRGGENFEVILAKSAEIEIGDKILTADLRPFILGEVQKIIKNESEPFQKIYFRYPFNLNELKYVYILK